MDGNDAGNGTPSARHAGLAVVAIVALALAYASVVQGTGWAQASHDALVRSLVSGTARIDAYQWTTGDKSYQDDHDYAQLEAGSAQS